MSLWRHARAVVLLPGTVTLLVPWLILDDDYELAGPAAVAAGALLIAAGFAVWLWTVLLLARIGKGTLAPWDPTEKLVIAGPYRHMRNPMITAVCVVLAGEALIFGSGGIAIWLAAFVVVNQAFFLLYEEPALEQRFGDEYRAYMESVPRWIPRR